MSNSRLRLLSLFFLLCSVFDSNALTSCRPDQIKSLEQFKNEFDSRGCNQSDYFNGVECDNATGAVTKLKLPHGCLSGILNPNSSLFGLRQIRYLDLSNNKFTSSSLPSQFGNLNRLEVLSLSFNSFIGQIPSSFSNLTMLTHLNLSHNDLTNSFPLLQNLIKLSILDLSYNHISGTIPDWLWNLPHLTIVTLVKNSLDGFESESLVNSSVQVLELGLNSFKGSFPNPPLSINILSAPNNSFNGEIPLSICNRSFLDVLDLSFNKFTGKIPRCLSNLTIVNLRENSLEGSIPDEFHKGSLTQTLDVGYNRLTGKLPRSLLNCSSLRFLNVYHNGLEDTFPFWLKALPNLQALILRSNRFYGSISPLDQSPLGFLELRVLELSSNDFTGNLPSNYFENWKASRLKRDEGKIYLGDYNTAYYIYQDSLDFQYKGSFMEQSKVLAACATINFSGNRLNGEIPESIGLLKALIALNLSNNAFTGHIPESLANLKELESLDLSSNQLSGNIPEGLGRLSFLAIVNVSHNQLKGRIPQGPQISSQPKSSFEGNAELCGLPLEVSCFRTPIQQKQEDEEEVLNWKAATIAYGPGVLLGLAIGQVIATYKQKSLLKTNSFTLTQKPLGSSC